jgi:RNA polymerase sigma-70 factor (ECF subfamily)
MSNEKTKLFLRYYTIHQQQIYAFIRAQVRCASDANDALQETSIALWEHFDRFDQSRDFGRWACGVARRIVLRQRRDAARMPMLLGDELAEQFADRLVSKLLESNQRSDALAACLRQLELRQRELLRERYTSGRNVNEIASRWKRTESAVYKTLAKIHEFLFDCVRLRMAED